jgi:hypothetical protein
MKKFSVTMNKIELEQLDKARKKLEQEIGMRVSRNAFVKGILFGRLKEQVKLVTSFSDDELLPTFKEPANADCNVNVGA